jgi:hypothetical protein
MKKVLVAIHLNTFFTGLFGIAIEMKRSKNWKPLICFSQQYTEIERDIQRCRQENIEVQFGPGNWSVNSNDSNKQENSPFHPTFAFRAFLFRGVKRINHIMVRSALFHFIKLSVHLAKVRRIIRKENVSILVLGGDIVHYNTAVYIRAAHLESIPAIVIAGWMLNQDENAILIFRDPNASCRRFYNMIISRLFPRWRYEYNGKKLLRLPPGQIIAREILKIAPPRPWTLHSGFADAIAMESQASCEIGVQEGLPPEQIHVTGSMNHDLMARFLKNLPKRRRELFTELGFNDIENRLIIAALPPNEFLHNGEIPGCDFTNYHDLVEFWVKSVSEIRGYNAVISLHPSLIYADMKYIEKWGAKISRRHTAELIALCDIFIVSLSTTIQWATACAKPIVNYDVFKYRQHDYEIITGMVTVERQDEFRLLLKRIASDEEYLQSLVRKQIACREQWGILDGRAKDRIFNLFDKVMADFGKS